jgi:aminoglycoside adenylyltransferase-like protein
MAGELRWAEEHAEWGNGVLNACQNLRFLEEGVIGSKVEGARWARSRVEDPSLVDAALEHRGVRDAREVERGAARRFLRHARERLLNAALI